MTLRRRRSLYGAADFLSLTIALGTQGATERVMLINEQSCK